MYQQRVEYHSKVKGRQYVSSHELTMFMWSEDFKNIHKEICKQLVLKNIYDPTVALSAKDLATEIGCTPTHITQNVGILKVPGFLLTARDEENPRLTRYYLNKQHFAPSGRTALGEVVDRYYKENEE